MTIKEIKEKGLLLFECISGSKAYGLNTAKSDTDLKGVYYLPKAQFYGLEYISQISNETSDEVYYELGRFVELLIKNNPNILELLASPDDCILYRHAIMSRLPISMFLSKLCKETFAGYALTQIKKARGYKKKIINPVEAERKTVPDFCFILQGHSSIPLNEWLAQNHFVQEQCGLTSIPHSKGLYALFYDKEARHHYRGIMSSELANDVSLSSIPKGEKEMAYLYFNIESYSSYCKDYKEYWEWVQKRNEDRYLGNAEHGKGYDAKNMMHTIRLLQVAEEILATGTLNVKRQNREELLSIKAGGFQYDELLAMANALMERIEKAELSSSLPSLPDKELVEGILVQMRAELYG
ncbi:nucleotidyltransferase [Niastella vici]|uniref:Nucleotidyltransferase n=1 Tax=Niastella vici TaxID=1703345 RepID=A0A1V9G5I1_9BACT|nr:nucleotidyltransferase domain-containing protein [Niastella vici]OQP65901.1 nucleotidyltransferase [Niastella vici]